MRRRLATWTPASVLAPRRYTPETFRHDLGAGITLGLAALPRLRATPETFRHALVAGITVGLVALPLAMAFAIASGLTPQAGIYCAIVTGFLISAMGGSKGQIGGPTRAL